MTRCEKFWEDLYLLDDGQVRQFLIVGNRDALLIDTGFPDSHLAEVVRTVTKLPVRVLLTHGDGDHTGGLEDFGECWLHEGDWPQVEGRGVKLHPLREGDVFTCGGYRLEVVEIIGHTYGSVAFVDWGKKLLLPGDSVQKDGPIYMFGEKRDLDLYIESQKKLLALADRFETVLPCHHACPIDPSYIGKNLEDAIALKAGALPSVPHPTMPCRIYQGKWTQFLYD